MALLGEMRRQWMELSGPKVICPTCGQHDADRGADARRPNGRGVGRGLLVLDCDVADIDTSVEEYVD